MRRATSFPLLAVPIFLLAACEQAGPSLTAPSALTRSAGAVFAPLASNGRWGAAAMRLAKTAAEQSSDLPCALGPFGQAERSHYTLSASGHESFVCSGKLEPAPERIIKLSEFPCTMPSGNVTTESQFVFTPSGHATLTCHGK